ncbi:MAG: cytochrome c4 [Burkholderiaceae bacterium]|nr:cytochrome c4 [Burkholderiaceae bacterium]
MNRAFFMKSLLAALFAVSSFANAAGDSAKGEALYSAGDAARNIPACVACHGAAGNSTISQNPKLAAQHEAYIVKQLTNFKSGERVNPVMAPIAKALTDDDAKNLAAYLNAQKLKPGAAHNKDTIEFGKSIFRGGIAEKNVPACAGCHGPTGAGIPAQFARIGGQHYDYTVEQLTNFSTGARKNNTMMQTIAHRMSIDEIQAVADYVAGLQ